MRVFHFLSLFLFLLALYSFPSALFAQDLSTTIFTARDGLAGDTITSVAFARDGSAWVGTTKGATHISDAGWVSYTRAHGLGDSWITALAVAPDERVWFGTQSGGVSVLDPRTKTFTTYNLDNSDISSNFVTALAVSQDNLVWVGTLDQGVALYNPQNDTWTRYTEPGKTVTALSLQSDGQPWVGTPNGVWSRFGDGWESRKAGDGQVRRIDTFDGKCYLTTDEARYVLMGDSWIPETRGDEISDALDAANLTDAQITAFGKDEQQRYWVGTPRGLWLVHKGNAFSLPQPLPVVLVHGWTVAGDDTLETSEFRFLKSYADRDGIPMYYARGVSPKNTLYENAQVIRDEIARVKKETGVDRVNLIGFSMGGMNTRAYLESSLYADDVNRAIILGTPQAGVDVWKPILFQEILSRPGEPSTVELSPEYAGLVNASRSPNPNVPYDLLIGDASRQEYLDYFADMPKTDALISVASSLALDGENVRKHVNADLHDWNPQAVPLEFTAYLYPGDTWERYLRNALRNHDNAPLGSEVQTPPLTPLLQGEGNSNLPSPAGKEVGEQVPVSNHTPVVTQKIDAGGVVTCTVLIDDNKSARFIAYFPDGHVDFSIVAPDGKKYKPEPLRREQNDGVLSLSTDLANISSYRVKNAQVGTWQLILERTDRGGEPIDVTTYVELDSPRRLVAYQDRAPADEMRALVTPGASDVKISARVGIPSAEHNAPYKLVPLPDPVEDARGPHTKLPFTTPGWYPVFVSARGDGFERETEFLYNVPADTITFQPGLALKIGQDSTAPNQNVPLSIGVAAKKAGRFALAAQIRDENDRVVARSFTPVTLGAGEQRIPFSLLVPEPAAWYTLQLMLYDADWAAMPGPLVQAKAKFQQSK